MPTRGTGLDPKMLQRLDPIIYQLLPQLDFTSDTACAEAAIRRMRAGFYNAENEQYTDTEMYEEDVETFVTHYPNAEPLQWQPMLIELFRAMIHETKELADYVAEFHPLYMPGLPPPPPPPAAAVDMHAENDD